MKMKVVKRDTNNNYANELFRNNPFLFGVICFFTFGRIARDLKPRFNNEREALSHDWKMIGGDMFKAFRESEM